MNGHLRAQGVMVCEIQINVINKDHLRERDCVSVCACHSISLICR